MNHRRNRSGRILESNSPKKKKLHSLTVQQQQQQQEYTHPLLYFARSHVDVWVVVGRMVDYEREERDPARLVGPA